MGSVGGDDDDDDGRRLRTDHVGVSRMVAALDGLVVRVRLVVVMARRRVRRQDEQMAIVDGSRR